MTQESKSLEFRLKNIEETNCFIKKIDQNELMTNKNKKVSTTLNYIEHFFTLVFLQLLGVFPFLLLLLYSISLGELWVLQ